MKEPREWTSLALRRGRCPDDRVASYRFEERLGNWRRGFKRRWYKTWGTDDAMERQLMAKFGSHPDHLHID